MKPRGSDTFKRIHDEYLPKGWTLRYGLGRHGLRRPDSGKAMAGICFRDDKLIALNARFHTLCVRDNEDIWVLLHEIGHAVDPTYSEVRHEREYFAERYAIRTMRQEGLTISHRLLTVAKDYVRDIAELYGEEITNREIKRWLRSG